LYEEGGSTSGFAIRLNGSDLVLGVANGGSRPIYQPVLLITSNVWTHIVGVYRSRNDLNSTSIRT
jgi:hypothetical protein